MWILKSRTVTKNLQAAVPGERLMMHVITVWEQGNEEVTIPFPIENLELMERTVLSIGDRLNNLEIEVATAQERPIMPERPLETEPPQPTEEELKDFAIAQKEAELAKEVELAKIRQLAETDPALASKLNELENLKTGFIKVK